MRARRRAKFILRSSKTQRDPKVHPSGTDAREYAAYIVEQIEALRAGGIPMRKITVIGFSKGAGIALRASSLMNRSDGRFVLLAICGPWLDQYPELELRGRVLSIYEASDSIGSSCNPLFKRSVEGLETEEIRIETGEQHGAFYRPRQEWLSPVVNWILNPELQSSD
jgi:hypothetical protein